MSYATDIATGAYPEDLVAVAVDIRRRLEAKGDAANRFNELEYDIIEAMMAGRAAQAVKANPVDWSDTSARQHVEQVL